MSPEALLQQEGLEHLTVRELHILRLLVSAYYGGMTIEHRSDPERDAMTILIGPLVDQSALMGVLNSLHDTGYQILAVECLEASAFTRRAARYPSQRGFRSK